MAPVDLLRPIPRHQILSATNPHSQPSPRPKASLTLGRAKPRPASLGQNGSQTLVGNGLSKPNQRIGISLRAMAKAQAEEQGQAVPSSVQLTQILPGQLRQSKGVVAQRWRQHINLLQRLQTNGQIYLQMEGFYAANPQEVAKEGEYSLLHAIEDLQQNIRDLLQPGLLIPSHRRNDSPDIQQGYNTFLYYLFVLNLALTVRSKEVALQQGVAPIDTSR